MNTNQTPFRHAAKLLAGLLSAAVLAAAGCAPKINSGVGFQLPKGDALRGQQAFIDLKCFACHTVDGVELPKPIVAPASVVILGGEVTQTRTYGRLMTAIIHPTERIAMRQNGRTGTPPAKSPMPTLNTSMTVAQLVDLITFLQPHYRELQPIYQPELTL